MRVFFFSCSCQSAVFFESLGVPWPIHACPQFATNSFGGGAFRRSMPGSRCTPSTSAAVGAFRLELPRPWKLMPRWRLPGEPVRRRRSTGDVLPEENRDFVGTVMSLDRNINVPRHFGLPSNPMASGLLGRLGRGRWHLIRVRDGEAAAEQPIVAELSAFLSARDAAKEGLREGRKLLVSVEPWAPPGRDPVWVVSEVTARPD